MEYKVGEVIALVENSRTKALVEMEYVKKMPFKAPALSLISPAIQRYVENTDGVKEVTMVRHGSRGKNPVYLLEVVLEDE